MEKKEKPRGNGAKVHSGYERFPQAAEHSFKIENLKPIDTGSGLRATFDLRVGAICLIGCRLMAGKDLFVSGPSSRDAYAPRGWRVHATLDADLAGAVCAEVCATLADGRAA